MIIVDTGIWIDHIRKPDHKLTLLAKDLQALMHPYVLGELALGSLPRRTYLLERLAIMPQPPVARLDLLMSLIEVGELASKGIGFVDAHLLASAKMLPGSRLWTRDKRLHKQAIRLNVAYTPA